MSIQQKIPGAAGGKDVWVDPGRDLAHILPDYVLWSTDHALRIAGDDEATVNEIVDYVTRFRAFLDAIEDPAVKSLKEALETSKLDVYLKDETKGAAMVKHQLYHIMLGAFFNGARESKKPDTLFYGFEELRNWLKELEPVK